MSQNYNQLVSGGTSFGALYGVLNGSTEALRSQFSGTAFPSSPAAGQACYRTDRGDNGLLYIYTNNPAIGESGWVEASVLSLIGVEVAAARGSKPDLDQRLDVALNEDGTLKSSVSAYQSEWIDPGFTVTYSTASEFTVVGDHTDIYTIGRGIKANLSGGAVYSHVLSASESGGTTTVELADAVLIDPITSIEHGIISTGAESSVAEASLTVTGIVKLADVADVDTGTDDTLAVTPAAISPALAGKADVITSDTTINVAATGADFTTLGAAYDYLRGFRIMPTAIVTISIVDGTYSESALTPDHPDGDRIRVRGSTESGTVLEYPADADAIFVDRTFFDIDVCTIKQASGATSGNGVTARLLGRVLVGFYVTIDGFAGSGVLAARGGTVEMANAIVNNCNTGIKVAAAGVVGAKGVSFSGNTVDTSQVALTTTVDGVIYR